MARPHGVAYIAGMTSETTPLVAASADHLERDIAVASRRPVPVLITAPPGGADTIVRAIAARAGTPAIDTCDVAAGDNVLTAFAKHDAAGAAGRSAILWIKDVHLLKPFHQAALGTLLSERAGAWHPAHRIVASTTVDLFERIGLKAFDRRLFYRLNTIHIVAG